MKTRHLLIGALFLLSACTQTSTSQPDRVAEEARIRETIDRAVEAFGAGDAKTLASLQTEDSVVLKPEAEPLIGRQARHDDLAAVFAKFDVDESRTIKDIDIAGDRAIVWGTYTVTLAPKDGSASIHETGNYIEVFHKQTNGDWLFARTAWNATTVTGP